MGKLENVVRLMWQPARGWFALLRQLRYPGSGYPALRGGGSAARTNPALAADFPAAWSALAYSGHATIYANATRRY